MHATLHAGADRTVDTKPCGINHVMRDEGSTKLADGTEHAFSGINPDKKHSKVDNRIPCGSKENNGVHALGVLLTRIINTEVDNCNQASGSKTWRCNIQFVNRVGFLNKSEDTQGLCYPRLEDRSLSEHVGFKIEIPG